MEKFEIDKERLIDIKSKIISVNDNISKNQILELEEIIKSMNMSEQLNLHGNLNFDELKIIFSIRYQLNISRDVLEHLIWQYFVTEMEFNGYKSKDLQSILETYKLTNFIAMESLIISILEKEIVTDEEIQMIRDAISDNAMEKAIIKYEITRKLKQNNIITIDDFEKIINFELYKLLLQIIKLNINNFELSGIFQEPKEGEKNYKIKKEIYKLLKDKNNHDLMHKQA